MKSHASKALACQEGDWFAVPLRQKSKSSKEYGIGLVARRDKNGIVVAYFFPPKRKVLPKLAELQGLSSKDSIKLGKFGDIRIVQGTWPILGRSNPWQRERWPLPSFCNYNEISKQAVRVDYQEDDLCEPVQYLPISLKEAYDLPRDTLHGPGAVEIVLTELLNGRSIIDPLRAQNLRISTGCYFIDRSNLSIYPLELCDVGCCTSQK